MEGHKDISDMSFEEFFSDKDRAPAEVQPVQKRAPPKAQYGGEIQQGFGATGPKINYRGGSFILYVPRYGSGQNARFDTAIECSTGVIPMERLESSPKGAGRLSRSTSIDLTAIGVSPMEEFRFTIDGEVVFTNKPRRIQYFNNTGLPMGKSIGDSYIVTARGVPLRLVRAEVLDTVDIGDVTVTHADVSMSGGVWLDEPRSGGEAPEAKADAVSPMQEAPESGPEAKEGPKPKAKRAGRRKKPTGSIKIPVGVQDAGIRFMGETLPLFAKFPSFKVSVENRDLDECEVSLRSPDGAIISGGRPPADGPMFFDIQSSGVMDLVLSCEGADLDRVRFALIQDFECSRPGNGDVTSDTSIAYTAFGQSGAWDAFDGPMDMEHDGQEMSVLWYVPAITWDAGRGPARYTGLAEDIPEEDVDSLGDSLVLTMHGIRRISLFIGPDKGKKRELPVDQDQEVCRLDLVPIKKEISASRQEHYSIYITVNSFPMRRFMGIRNPEKVGVLASEGMVNVSVRGAGDFRCRFFMMDKSVREVVLAEGDNAVSVPDGAVEAEVSEVRGAEHVHPIPVAVRRLPFLSRDELGDIWLYVSRDKRIPLPGDLASSRPDPSKVRQWHDQIVRMNPELKVVSPAMMQSAFDAMDW